MEPKSSSPHSQEPATCPYPELDKSSVCPSSNLSNIIYPSIYAWVFQVVSIHSGFPTKALYAALLSPIRAKCGQL